MCGLDLLVGQAGLQQRAIADDDLAAGYRDLRASSVTADVGPRNRGWIRGVGHGCVG